MRKEDNVEVREFTNPEIDKSGWGEGPWMNEPDKIHWIDPTTDLDVLMVRNHSGAWCGYVGVTEGHPFFRTGYDACGLDKACNPDDYTYSCEHTPNRHVEVHGGITFADSCQETEDPAQGICHVPFAGRPDDVWWLGFDCAHAMDLVPGTRSFMQGFLTTMLEGGGYGDTYRDRAYVEEEVRSLAAQLKEIAVSGLGSSRY
jgi:hypothetical protein